MIFGSIEQLLQLGTGEPWHSSLQSLKRAKLRSPLGIISISSENHFINIHTYTTKARSECRFESHRKTIDLQYMISGDELIDLTKVSNLEVDGEYIDETDFQFHRTVNHRAYSTIHLKPQTVAIFFPDDPHRPQIAYEEKCIEIKKAVVKLPVDLS